MSFGRRNSCGRRCLCCWRNKLKHSNKNTKCKSLEIIFPDDSRVDTIYNNFIDDCLDSETMSEIYYDGNEELGKNYYQKDLKDIHNSLYKAFILWLMTRGISTKKYTRVKVRKEFNYMFEGAIRYVIILPMYVEYEGKRKVEKKEREDCCVCLEDSNVISNCNHFFCKSCMHNMKILGKNFNCPYCKNEDFKLFTMTSN